MSDEIHEGSYCLPSITGVQLSSFDLFRRKPDVGVILDKPVYCLIGANGLGKSSFLNTILYGLTGGLPCRTRGFSSPKEYAEEATRFDRRQDYFGGRLSEMALEHAAITIELAWPERKVLVTRNLFGASAVTDLSIRDGSKKNAIDTNGKDLDSTYKSLIVDECGLPDFNQFIFLLHYVCAFDEDRHLLLWDPVPLTNALYLAFGSDADQAALANELKRKVERYGSRARNSRFAARRSLDEANQLRKVLEGDESTGQIDEVTIKDYSKLNKQLDDAVERLHLKEAELRKIEALVSDRSAMLTELQLEYDKIFSARSTEASLIHHHPLVRYTIQNDTCALCSTQHVAEKIQRSIEEHNCPLCGNILPKSIDEESMLVNLKKLDKEIEDVRDNLRFMLNRRSRLKDEYETSLQIESGARRARDEFLSIYPNVESLTSSKSESNTINSAIKKLLEEAGRFNAKSKSEYKQRNDAREQLHTIEYQLQKQFDQYSERFSELFRNHAEKFIGLEVDIELEHRKGRNETGFELLLSLQNQPRTRSEDVSESQRFFLDIALRMALAEFMNTENATLLIDTPEGSLDITYEARAGDMFSNFANRGNTIVLTANLRSSALLRRLAERQTTLGMKIERMTEWTDLSEVQQQEESLFREAYIEIEEAMR